MTWRRALVGVAVVLYAVSLLWLSVGTPGTFTSPDENAAYVFAQMWRTTGDLRVPEGMNLALDGIVHPRSVYAVGPWLVPGSFLALPVLAGTLGMATGSFGILLLTPLLAVLAVFAWRAVVARVFGDARLATIAAVLLAVTPAFWYYSARTMMHNVAFVAMLIFAAWFVVVKPLSAHMSRSGLLVGNSIEWILAGLCVGVALALRTSEVLWIGASLVGIFTWQRVPLLRVARFVLGAALPLVLLALLQAHLFGNPLVNGYTASDVASVPSSSSALDATPAPYVNVLTTIGGVLLPFGFHEFAIAKNVWHFGLALFPWMTVLVVAGAAITARHSKKDAWTLLLLLLVGIALWLGVVYGSWSFNDNPDPTAVTLADSHVRYWLPVFVLATPFAARALLVFSRGSLARAWAATACVAVLSGVLVFTGSDGLVRAREELFASAAKRDALLAATEDDAIIVVDRADKFLWPWRSVIVPLRSDATYAAMPGAAAIAPLYYFGIPFPESDMTYLNEVKLAALGLRIAHVVTVDDEALYRITPRE